MKAVINYGHGPKDAGYDPGAIGPTGYEEATENREVGELVVAKLRRTEWEVLAIQDGDLWDVTNQSNAWKPDYFLSVHANSFADTNAHGIETIAYSAGGMGEKMAKEIQKELVFATGLADRGMKFGNLHVLRETNCPAALVEVGFISNPAEEALMKQDRWDELVASAICRGFSRAVGVAYAEKEGGGDDVLDVAILKYSAEDEWAAKDIDAKLGGVANFTRQGTTLPKAIPAAALSAKKLIIIGGPDVPEHPNRVYLSGQTKYDTAVTVGKYLG